MRLIENTKNALCWQNVEFYMLNVLVHKLTTPVERKKKK